MKENSVAVSEPLVQRFLQMLRSQPSDQECHKQLLVLDGYISAQLTGAAMMAQFSDTAVHLDTCLLCAEAYALLYDVRVAEQAAQLREPPAIPAPDLSFLQPQPGLSSLLSQQLQTIADTIRLQLSEQLLAFLQPLPQMAPVRSASKRYTDVLYSLTPEHVPALSLPFSLTAYKDLQDDQICLVEINVTPAGVSWPDLEGYTVQLAYDEQLVSQKTDDWGTAVIPHIPLAQLPNLTVVIENP